MWKIRSYWRLFNKGIEISRFFFFKEIPLVGIWKKEENKKKPETSHWAGHKSLGNGYIVIEALNTVNNRDGEELNWWFLILSHIRTIWKSLENIPVSGLHPSLLVTFKSSCTPAPTYTASPITYTAVLHPQQNGAFVPISEYTMEYMWHRKKENCMGIFMSGPQVSKHLLFSYQPKWLLWMQLPSMHPGNSSVAVWGRRGNEFDESYGWNFIP